MSDLTTKVMLDKYVEDREPIGFLAGQFQSPPKNFHNKEEIEIDIKRNGRKIAIAVVNLSTGARLNSSDLFTNKAYKPAIYREAASINAHDLFKRDMGQNPFEDYDFQMKAVERGIDVGIEMSSKIMRALEVQASQVFQTGKITLVDELNNDVYEIDFIPKTSHFPSVSVTWGQTGDSKISDIGSLCRQIKTDGKLTPDLLEMGHTAYELFIQDDAVLKRLDNTRIEGNGIVPLERMGNGGLYRGVIEIDNYRLDVWTYDESYENPVNGNDTPYITPDKVIVRASKGRMDATFGLIPRIGAPDPRVPTELLQRISSASDMIDLQHWSWLQPDGSALMVEVGTRALMIPTAIDTFGCLTTTAP